MKQLQKLAQLLDARRNCVDSRHEIEEMIKRLPSGSGIDHGSKINYEKCSEKRIVIDSAFHIMDSNGTYTSWIDYQVTVTPDLQFLFNLKIVGPFSTTKNAAGLKYYLGELYTNHFADN